MEVFPEGLLHGGLLLLLAEQVIEDAEDTSASADRPYGAAGTWTGKLITRHGLFFLDKPPYRLPGSYMNDRSVSRLVSGALGGRKMKESKRDRVQIEPAFLRAEEAARFLGISRRYLSKLTAVRLLPVHRLGRRCARYSREDLLAAMATFRQ